MTLGSEMTDADNIMNTQHFGSYYYYYYYYY